MDSPYAYSKKIFTITCCVVVLTPIIAKAGTCTDASFFSSITARVISTTCGNNNGFITVFATGGAAPYLYSINGVNFTKDSVFEHLTADSYTVYVKDALNAISTAIITVPNIAGPQFTAAATKATCSNDDGEILINASVGTPPYRYSTGNVIFTGDSLFAGLKSGEYNVTVTDANNCAQISRVTIGVTNNLTVYAGNDLVVCEGKSVLISANSAATRYHWTPETGITDSVLREIVVYPDTTTEYFVTASTSVCTAKDSVMVFVNPAPTANAGHDTAICYGESLQLNASGGTQYEWSPATYLSDANISNPVAVKPLTTITYGLSVTDVKKCKSLAYDNITITVTPPAAIDAGPDTSIAFNQPLQLYAQDVNNSGFSHYTWSPPYALNNAQIQNPVSITNNNVIYTITASTQNGCKAYDTISVKAFKGPDIYVPTAFSPNHDGHNDVLKATPAGIKAFKYFAVYDRWGAKVFYTTNSAVGWDGLIKGKKQPLNTFAWAAAGIDYTGKPVERTGTVTLFP